MIDLPIIAESHFMVPAWVVWATAFGILALTMQRLIVIANNYWRGGTENVVKDMQEQGLLPTKESWEALLGDIADIKTQAAKIEYLEHKIQNGLTETVEGISNRQDKFDTKLDDISASLARLEGKAEKAEAREKGT